MTSPGRVLCLVLALSSSPALANNQPNTSEQQTQSPWGQQQGTQSQVQSQVGSGITLPPPNGGIIIRPGAGFPTLPHTIPNLGGSGGSGASGGSGGGPSQGPASGGGGEGGGGQTIQNDPAKHPGAVTEAPAASHRVVGETMDSSGSFGGRPLSLPDAPASANGAVSRAADGPDAQRAGQKAPNPLEKELGSIAALPESRTPDQKKADALVQQARTLFVVGGEPQKALESLGEAVRLDPANVRGFVRRAEIENKLGQHPEALADAKKALALDGRDGEAWDQAAWAMFRTGRYQDAVNAASQALSLDPSNAFALAIRARAKWALGDKAGALADARAAAALDARFQGLAGAMNEGSYTDKGDLVADDAAAVSAPGRARSKGALAVLAALLMAALGFGARFAFRQSAKARTFSSLAATTMPATRHGGRLAGKYELIRLLGKGGMGTVHEAFDHTLKRKVAAKKMADGLAEINPQAKQLLLKEAQTVAALHHPSIVDIYEIVEDGPDLYLVFELVTGKTLSQLLAESGPLPLARCAELLKPVCDALQFAHKQELVHRDLKPGNVMISEDGRVKLMDFGIARPTGVTPAKPGPTPVSPVLAHTRMVMGTPLYMAPEMDHGVVCKEGDVYALGVCLYEMLTGIAPFKTNEDKLALRWTPPSSLVPGLTHRVDQLLERALQPDPVQRLRTPLAFYAGLSAACQPGSTPPDAAVLPAKA